MNNASWESVANVQNGVSLQLGKRNVKEIGEPTHLSCDKREPPDLLNCVLKSCAWTVLNVKVAQKCPTLRPHGHPWNFLCQNTGVGNLSLLQGIFQTQGLNRGLPHCRWILYQLSHQGSQRILEWVAYPFSSGTSGLRNRTFPFSRGSSQPRDRTQVSSIAGGFFTSWATRETQTILKAVVKEKKSVSSDNRHIWWSSWKGCGNFITEKTNINI